MEAHTHRRTLRCQLQGAQCSAVGAPLWGGARCWQDHPAAHAAMHTQLGGSRRLCSPGHPRERGVQLVEVSDFAVGCALEKGSQGHKHKHRTERGIGLPAA